MEITRDTFTLEMAAIGQYLNTAIDEGVDVEVVTWALKAMKDDPELSISDAMAIGYSEWVK
jgi:tRNA A-37 threonylcarbamoyl transferase component Bud32